MYIYNCKRNINICYCRRKSQEQSKKVSTGDNASGLELKFVMFEVTWDKCSSKTETKQNKTKKSGKCNKRRNIIFPLKVEKSLLRRKDVLQLLPELRIS